MKATRILLAAMVLGTVISANQANAQTSCGGVGSCNQTNTASVTVGALVKLTMSSAITTLTPPAPADLGFSVYDAGPTFTVKANRAWSLKIKTTASPNWTYTGTDGGVKPISDLTWANGAIGTYAPITTVDQTLSSSATSSNGVAAEVHFKTLWTSDFTAASNAPGQYSLPIVFTLSAP